MQRFSVTGMSCAACSARVEKAVNAIPDVASCTVSLLTNSMSVQGTATPEQIIQAVVAAGYQATLKEESVASSAPSISAAPRDDTHHEQKTLLVRLLVSLALLAVLMYLSMFGVMMNAPLPTYLQQNPTAIALIEMLLAAAVMIINQRFFVSGTRGLLHGAPNMDTLVALGSAASFGYSTYLLFTMLETANAGNHAWLHQTLHGLYFESAAMILALITLGKLLEARSKGKTTDALKSLMDLSPKTAVILREGQEITVPVSQVRRDDVFVVRPGEAIPVDGIVLEGSAAVNEAALTGESVPADKEPGDHVSAATVNQSGYLRCRAERVGEDTTLSQIIRMVSDAAATKAPISKLADKVSGIFVPVVLVIALVTVLAWLTVGHESVGFAIARGISVLVISCPCALGLATPVAIMVGNGVGAKRGILFKTAAALEGAGRVQVVALDKTGTITRGEPSVTDLFAADTITQRQLLQYAATLEQHSEHPLAKAILSESQKRGLLVDQVDHFEVLPGNGLRAEVLAGGERCCLMGGKRALIEQQIGKSLPQKMIEMAEKLSDAGKTPLYFAKDEHFLGMIAVADVIKEDSAQAIATLKKMGLRVVMLTGDNQRTARAIGEIAGVDEIVAGVLPDEKEQVIRTLQARGKVAMVGDGINDAPALTRADTGIAIGAGTDVAIEAADVVLMNSSLRDVATALKLGRATLRNIRQNLFWAFFYNSVGIPLAAGVFIRLFGWELNPMFAAAAMSLSSFCVVSNALRLNYFRAPVWTENINHQVQTEAAAQQNENNDVEDKQMNITIKVEGMMCPHCSGRVKKTLEALAQVACAEVSHEAGTAVVTPAAEQSAEEVLALCVTAITEAGYTVVD